MRLTMARRHDDRRTLYVAHLPSLQADSRSAGHDISDVHYLGHKSPTQFPLPLPGQTNSALALTRRCLTNHFKT
jgi:hypothetical protein